MNFLEYKSKFDCQPLEQTEQSWTFIVRREGEKRVCKKYSSELNRFREEISYLYLKERRFLEIPRITLIGADFIEMDYIEKTGSVGVEEAIRSISKMYIQTERESNPKRDFPKIDLSKDKLFRRLHYIPSELKARGFMDKCLIDRSISFVKRKYKPSPHRCIVHGDLKSPHVIKNNDKVFFIDLALLSVASPWYDLAFFFMEREDNFSFFEKLSESANKVLGREFSVGLNDIKDYLRSAIFYRSVYDVGFAVRHRSDKILKRTIKDLGEILEEQRFIN